MRLTDDQLDELGNEGRVDLGDGTWLTFQDSPDDSTSLGDFPDCYGRATHLPRGKQDSQRPKDYNGAAEKVWGQSECYWWQPPHGIAPEYLGGLRSTVRDILAYGFVVYEVRRWHLCDKCGGECKDLETLGGIEPALSGEARREILRNLAFNLDNDYTVTA